MKHLNYFEPFQSRTSWHEDQLTRAFLVTFRFVPMVQSLFMDLIREIQVEKGSEVIVPTLPRIAASNLQIQTQVGSISTPTARLVSIIMSDESWEPKNAVQPSSRIARYDGVIQFQPDWTFVVENKPRSANINEEQANPNIDPGFEGTIDPIGLGLSWRKVIESMTALVERNLISGAEWLLVNDFLEFVDDNYDYLNPFSSFRVCKNNDYLLRKRCKAILEATNLGPVYLKRGFENYIELASGACRELYLMAKPEGGEDWTLSLKLWPADTKNQARDFFQTFDESRFLHLKEEGWEIQPNLHFAFIQSHLHWAKEGRMNVSDYLQYWKKHQNEIRQYSRKEFESLFEKLRNERLITDQDINSLQQKFVESNRNSVNLCPGLELSYSWKKSEAIDLDSKASFPSRIRKLAGNALSTWSQTLPPIKETPATVDS